MLAVVYFPQLIISIHKVDIQFTVFYHLYLTHLGRIMDTDEDDRCKAMEIPYVEVQVLERSEAKLESEQICIWMVMAKH